MSASALQLENQEQKALIARFESELAVRDALLADRDAQIDKLARCLAGLEAKLQALYARRAQDLLIPEGQGVLFSVDLELADATSEHANEAPDGETTGDSIKRRARPKAPAKKVDTSALERVERRHELPEDERYCPDTGLPLVPVGERTFDEIEYDPARLFIIHHVQVVYGLAPDDAETRQADFQVAPLPPRPLKGCAAGAVLLAWILVQKYGHHLPLYRQEAIFKREGLKLPRQTTCDWVLAAADVLAPIADCLMGKIRAGPVMQLDDTPIICQGGKGKGKFQAYLWVFANPEVDGVVYRFTPGRASALIVDELGAFEGYCVGDGYSGNMKAARDAPGEVVMTGCWAHSTRKFRDALVEAPGTAVLFQDDIRALFDIEEEATDEELTHEHRCQLRNERSRSILARLFRRGRRIRSEYSDAGLMAKAIGYMLNQRKPLRRFLEDGRIPIDNNRCERAIRPVAVGRRNWLFAGSERGGRAAAIAYTVIESCRMAKVDMLAYLADVLVRVGSQPVSQMEELLPTNWVSGAGLAVESRTEVAESH